MKLLVIFLTLIIAFTSANNITEDAAQRLPEQNLIPKFTELIEFLKTQNKYDPFNLGEKNVHIDDKTLDIKLDGNVTVKGLLNIVPKKLAINFIFKYTFELLFPEIELLISDYNLEGSLGLLKIFGKGITSVILTDTVIKGTGSVTWKDKEHTSIYLKSITPDVKINGFHFLITGYLNDEFRSAMMSKMITNIGAPLITQNIGLINTELGKIIMKLSEGLFINYPL